MSTPPDRRTRKRLATRQAISDAATRLFHERGFDRVTVDDIAEAADVGRMTVFNHFPRKEDMFFDLDEVGREDLFEALLRRAPDASPIEAIRLLVHRAVREQKPYVRFSQESQRFIETMQASEPLKARARAIRDELARGLTVALANAVGRGPGDPDADLAASLLVTTWSVAYAQAQAIFQKSQDAEEAQALFLALVDKGTMGLNAMLAGTPYA